MTTRRTFLKLVLAAGAVGGLPGGTALGDVVRERDQVVYSNVPDGWLVCDGSELSREEYPELWQALQERFGGGNLPDYRPANWKQALEMERGFVSEPFSEMRPHFTFPVALVRAKHSSLLPIGMVTVVSSNSVTMH